MRSLSELMQSGASTWLFFPTAVVLGALHGLEPGHSKTVMTSFIVAVRGTVRQAILLGLCAAFSHSLIVWILAGVGISFGSHWNTEATEPYFQLASAALILLIAFWMLWTIYRGRRPQAGHDHGEEGPHDGMMIQTGHEDVEISVYETGMPPHFRLYFFDHGIQGPPPGNPTELEIVTVRSGDVRQKFSFTRKGEFLESTTDIPEPHEFMAELTISHGGHSHSFRKQFTEDHHHSHEGLEVGSADFKDAHAQAHAEDIRKRFTNQNVTTGQIVLFGLTGGLIPCTAAITVLLLCLQTHRALLGFLLVMGFSTGLAATMVASGVLAAWGMRHATKRFRRFSGLVEKAPYISIAVVICLGLFMGLQAWKHIR